MEGTGSIELPIEIEQAGGLSGNLTVNVAMASTAVAGEDYNLATTTLSIPAGSTDALSLDLEVLDNSSMSGKYLILEFDESSTASIGSGSRLIVLIADNDDMAPVAQADPSTRVRNKKDWSWIAGGIKPRSTSLCRLGAAFRSCEDSFS